MNFSIRIDSFRGEIRTRLDIVQSGVATQTPLGLRIGVDVLHLQGVGHLRVPIELYRTQRNS